MDMNNASNDNNITVSASSSQHGTTAKPIPSMTMSLADILASVERSLASLSDQSQRILPAKHVKPASFIPSTATRTEEFAEEVPPTEMWTALPIPKDVLDALKPLMQLQTDTACKNPDMQGLFHMLAYELGASRHLLPEFRKQFAAPKHHGQPIYDPVVLHRWLTDRQLERCQLDDMTKADRTLPLPVYDSNKGFYESDISAYTNHDLLEEDWGTVRVKTADDLLRNEKEDAPARSPYASPTSSLRLRPNTITSVHAAGGFTWMQRALDQQAVCEQPVDYLMYREYLTRAMGRADAASVRGEAASYPMDGKRASYRTSVLAAREEEAAALPLPLEISPTKP